MIDAALAYLSRITVIVSLSCLAISCGTGDDPKSIFASCTDVGDINFSQAKYLPTTGAKITVSDACRPLETVSYTLGNGTSSITISVTLNPQSDGEVTANFGPTNAATRTIAVNAGDVLTATYTDSNGILHTDTADITAALATGVYSETNTDPALPIAELVTRVGSGKLTAVDDEFQDPAVTPLDGLVSLEAVYDIALPGDNENGFTFNFGPPTATNSSFELPDASTGDITCSADWDCFNSSLTVSNNYMPGGAGTFASPNAPNARSGSQVMKQFNFDGGAKQSVPARAGDAVTVSAYAMNWTGDEFRNRAILAVGFLDASGNVINDGGKAVVADTIDDAEIQLLPQDGADITDWTLFEVSTVAPVNTAKAEVVFLHQLIDSTPNSGSVFWDDVKLAVGPGAIGEDLSDFAVLRFALNTTAAAGLVDLEMKIEDAASGSGSVFLAAAPAPTPDATNPDWNLYEIPLADFGAGLDWTRITSLGFYNASSTDTVGGTVAPTLVDATLYFDDINFAVGAPLPPAAAPVMTGILLNSPMEGVSFSTNTRTGVTNALGEFEYIEGELVTFSIGGITLGTVAGADVITPVELTGSLDPSDQRAINMLVFLQSIDDDPAPGIQISQQTRTDLAFASLNFDLEAIPFGNALTPVVNAVTDPDNVLVDETTALDNFYDTYVSFDGTQTFNWLFPGRDPVGEPGFDLVWSDEFNLDGAPSDYWTIEKGYGNNGWGNDEWQQYTDDPANVSVDAGFLNINALCSDPDDDCTGATANKRTGTITSARINTSGAFSFKYGKIKARIKPPVGTSAWPAFWMLGADFPTVDWPLVGEIDIMELNNFVDNERTTLFTLHWCDESLPTYQPDCLPMPEGWTFFTQRLEFEDSLGDDFHVFEAQWDETGIHGFIDGIQYFTRDFDGNMEEFLEEFFIILNVAIGGNLGGPNGPDATTTWPQTMLVDYVRVYQPTGGNGTATIVPPASTVSGANTTINPASPGAAAGSTVQITVQAKDGADIDIPVSVGTVTLTATSTSGLAVLSNYNDPGNGSYTFDLTNTKAEQVTLSGTIDVDGTIIDISAQPTVDFMPATVSGLPAGTTVTADNTSLALGALATITVQAQDQYGNAIPDDVGSLTLGITPDDTGTTATLINNGYQGAGEYEWTLTASAPQNYTVNGTFDTSTGVDDVGIVPIGNTVDIDFTGNPILGTNSTIVTNPDPLPAPPTAGIDDVIIEVQAVNNIGGDVTTCTAVVELFLASTSGLAEVDGTTGSAVVSNCTLGLYTATISNQRAEQVSVTGTIAGQNIGAGDPTAVDIVFEPGTVDADDTTITAQPASAASNGIDSSTITVQAKDEFGNDIPDDVGTLTLDTVPTGGTAVFDPNPANFAGGVYTATVTSSDPGAVVIGGSFDTSTGVVNIGVVGITATTSVTFEPPVGLFSDTNSDPLTKVAYKDFIDTVGSCNQTLVAVDMVTVFEGADALSAMFTSGGAGCNGFAFDFDFGGPGSFEYSQDFEALTAGSATALGLIGGAGFQVFGDVWLGDVGTGVFQYGYGPFSASNPSPGPGFSELINGTDGGLDQGSQYMNVFSDYNNLDHTAGGSCGGVGCTINTSVLKNRLSGSNEILIAADEIGARYRFSADYRSNPGGGIEDAVQPITQANAFIVTLDPGAGFASTNDLRFDTTGASSADWATLSLEIELNDPLLEGQILQFGFNTTATEYDSTGIFYDNLVFEALPTDISGFSRMVFAINTTDVLAVPDVLADLEIRFEDTDGDNGSLYLDDDATIVVPTDGSNWTVYQLDLSDPGLVAAGLDLDKLTTVGFYDASNTDTAGGTVAPTLIDATLYFDDIHFIQ